MSSDYLERIDAELENGVKKLDIVSVKKTAEVHYARAGNNFIEIAVFDSFIFAKHGDRCYSIEIPDDGIAILFEEDPQYIEQNFVTSGISASKDQFYFVSDEWTQFLFLLKTIRKIYTKGGDL